MNPNFTKDVRELIHKSLSKSLYKKFSWFPIRMSSGKWIWFQYYWVTESFLLSIDMNSPNGDAISRYFIFKCTDQEKLIHILKGDIEDEKISYKFFKHLRTRYEIIKND